jgi:hypothetical protein
VLKFSQFVLVEEFGHLHTSLGLARADMPQVAFKDQPELLNYLAGHGADHEHTSIPARSLRPTQREIDWNKVTDLKASADDKPVIVSSDSFVVDGHHRWAKALLSGATLKCLRISMPVMQLLKAMQEFPKTFYAAPQNEYSSIHHTMGVHSETKY